MRGVQNAPRQANFIAARLERFDYLFEKLPVSPDSKPFDVLENEVRGIEFADDPHKLFHERVPWIVQRSVTDQRKSLTRRTSEHYVDAPPADAGSSSNFLARKSNDRSRENRTIRKIVLVNGGVNGIDFDRSCH